MRTEIKREYFRKKYKKMLDGMGQLVPNHIDDIEASLKKLGYTSLKKFITDKYNERYGAPAIGKMLGVSESAIYDWWKRVGIKPMPRGGQKWRKYDG